MAKGWHRESRRHSMAARGVKTAVQGKPMTKVPPKKNFNLVFKEPAVKDYIMTLKKNGFRVFVRKDFERDGKSYATNWGTFTKGDNIGYFQYEPFRGFSFSTVHKGNRTTGTGYQTSTEVYEPTVKNAEETFVNAPNWAKKSELSTIKKYDGIKEYLEEDSFRKGYIEVR